MICTHTELIVIGLSTLECLQTILMFDEFLSERVTTRETREVNENEPWNWTSDIWDGRVDLLHSSILSETFIWFTCCGFIIMVLLHMFTHTHQNTGNIYIFI